jgi:hypothetical protein
MFVATQSQTQTRMTTVSVPLPGRRLGLCGLSPGAAMSQRRKIRRIRYQSVAAQRALVH